MNIYEVGSAPNYVGPLIVTNTTEFQIPYRPSPDLVNCPATTKWFKDGVCNDGFAFPITFDLSAGGIILPDEVIVTVTYNTQLWGYAKLNTVGPYNALNVGAVVGGTASVGSIPDTDDVVMYADNIPTGLADCNPLPICDKYKDGGEELVLRRATGWFDSQFVLRLNTLAPRRP